MANCDFLLQKQNVDLRYIFTLVLFLAQIIGNIRCQQQYFRVRPADIEAGEGSVAVIPCEVGHRAGRVQWTKDGLTLGYERSIPGIPRYTVLGSDNSGTFSLQIVNVSLQDDADFECQVGPANYNKPIRAAAHLSVLLPPTSIEIIGHRSGSRIDVREHEELELKCRVSNSKPKANIIWYRKDSRYVTESREDTEEDGTIGGRKTVTSTIKFRPTSRDNQASFACEAQHSALGPHNSPMRVTVVLSVLFPPGPPEIQGYIEGETIRKGQTVSLTCVSHGGNPLATINWLKNDQQIDFSYTTSGRESRNMYTFVATSEDNNARYRCEAMNQMSIEPMKAEIVLSVQFAPDKVTIKGPSDAKVGESLRFECSTSNSNPPASVTWVVDGRSVNENFTHSATSPNGGWTTKSALTVVIDANDRNKMISCYAVNQELGETIVETHMISVLYPPGTPNITGVTSDTILEEGQVKRLTCISMAGNPLADLKWFRGGVEIGGTTTVKGDGGDYSRSELVLTANRTDNGVDYRCDASNPATTTPLQSEIKLLVRFKPSFVTITAEPDNPKAGSKAILTCVSGSSNPTATIVWRHNDQRLLGVDTAVKPGDFGGNITTNILEVEVKPEHHGSVFICEATNEELQESTHNAKTLSVKYKPEFLNVSDISEEKVFTVEEGKSIMINLPAKANPPEIEYKWTSPGRGNIPESSEALPESRIIALASGRLNVTQAKREDAGKYKVKASNSEGKTTIKFALDVLYAPSITDITSHIMVNPGDDAEMVCTVDANPFKDDTVQWTREEFEMEKRTQKTIVGSSVYLIVKNVTADDAGEFTCQVNNGIGAEVKNKTFLLVRHKPKIDTSPSIAKSASDKGKTGVLTCKAKGAPDVSFNWSRKGAVINVEKSDGKYEVSSKMVDRLTWQSELSVKNVTSTDYGSYDCIAQNEMGLARYSIYLNVTSRPDPPAYLRILNITYNSVHLSWTPGFDGGFQQSFKIRYRKEDAENYNYVDVLPPGGDSFEVQDLKVGTKYSFSIMAFNSVGHSEYTKDIGKVETKSPLPLESDNVEGRLSRGIIVTITLVAALLLILNVVLISCYVRRRNAARKQLHGGSSTDSTKSATIEMYVGSSYNDTMSGETMSSVSEKSGSYISANHMHPHHHHHHHPVHHYHGHRDDRDEDEEDDDFEEEEDLTANRLGAASTYLVDHSHIYGSRDPHAVTSYATMPRKPLNGAANGISTVVNNGGGTYRRDQQHYADERRRQAYIQSLDDQLDSPTMSSNLQSSQQQQQYSHTQQPVFQVKPPNFQELYVDAKFTEYKGLYVAPADPQDYGYLPPPPRPPMPSTALYRSASVSGSAAVTTVVYPETLGHLV